MIAIALMALVIAGAFVAALAVVVVGIHAGERHKSLSAAPRTRTELIARQVLGVRAARDQAQRSRPVKEVARD